MSGQYLFTFLCLCECVQARAYVMDPHLNPGQAGHGIHPLLDLSQYPAISKTWTECPFVILSLVIFAELQH